MRTEALDLAARFGYGARGMVYLVIGGLAVAAAVRAGGDAPGSKGAMEALRGAPWGTAVLVAIGVGLFAYAFWRGLQAIFDADCHGQDAKGLAVRGALLVSAITHTLLGVYALSLVFAYGSAGSGSSESGSKGAAAWLMQQPFGRYLVAAVAVAIAGAGFAHFLKGCRGGYREHLKVSERLMKVLIPICSFGLAARGFLFLIVAGFFLYAAWTVDPDQAGGLDSALAWLRRQSYGETLFAIVAAGLFAFGLYSLIEALWRRVRPGGADGEILSQG